MEWSVQNAVDAGADGEAPGAGNRRGGGTLLIFDRNASGNAKPKSAIRGPNAGVGGRVNQIQVYPPKGWIIASTGGSISVWSIDDKGDVPPRWRIPIQKMTGGGSSGVALDPIHKEIITGNSVLNSVMTFYFPEIF